MNLLGRIGLAVALAAMVPALAVGLLLWNGAISPAQAVGLPDPGALTRWGLPVSRAVRDLSADVTIGALVLAAVAIPPEKASEPGQLSGVRARALAGAAAFGFLWAWAGLAVVVFTYSDLAGISPLAADGLDQLAYFTTDFELGGALLASTTLAYPIGFIPQWIRSDRREARRSDRQLDRLKGEATTMLTPVGRGVAASPIGPPGCALLSVSAVTTLPTV